MKKVMGLSAVLLAAGVAVAAVTGAIPISQIEGVTFDGQTVAFDPAVWEGQGDGLFKKKKRGSLFTARCECDKACSDDTCAIHLLIDEDGWESLTCEGYCTGCEEGDHGFCNFSFDYTPDPRKPAETVPVEY